MKPYAIDSIRHVHILAFGVLFLFLCRGQYVHVAARRSTELRVVASRYRHLYSLTRLVPPIVVPIIIFSGLALMEILGRSVREGWLCVLVAIVGLEMGEGIGHYTPYVRRLKLFSEDSLERSEATPGLRRAMTSRGDNFFFTLHLLSFPVAYWFGLMKPRFAIPFEPAIERLERVTAHSSLPAVILLVCELIVVISLRHFQNLRQG